MSEEMTPAPECYCEGTHLVFDTEAEAIVAEAQISEQMHFSGVTHRWDVPRQCADGRWIFARPTANVGSDVAEGERAENALPAEDDLTRRDFLGMGEV